MTGVARGAARGDPAQHGGDRQAAAPGLHPRARRRSTRADITAALGLAHPHDGRSTGAPRRTRGRWAAWAGSRPRARSTSCSSRAARRTRPVRRGHGCDSRAGLGAARGLDPAGGAQPGRGLARAGGGGPVAADAHLSRAGKAVLTAPDRRRAAPDSPPRPGSFYIRNKLTRYASACYGPLAFGTSARSRLTDWPGGRVHRDPRHQPPRAAARARCRTAASA